MFAAQPAQAVPQELILKNPPVLQPCQKPTPPTTPLVTPKATENQAQAATEERILKNPPVLQPTEKPTLGNTLLATPKATAGVSPKNEQQFDLKIQYIDSKICNPATGQYDNVRLRGYTGTGSNPNDPYVAPTIEIKPGDTVRISLKNELPIDPTCFGQTEVNTPHCFNGTNLHSHGLWVSPTGNSDNVLLSINPGVSFQYEYNLPPDHPSGTFWYHPHRHGSTALQVSSGMAGALIVRGDRLPKLPPDIGSKFVHGDIDTLLKDGQGNPFEEHILVLQQIQYYCPNSDNPWVCSPSDTGVIESYNNFGPRTWDQSGRYTTINGEVLPTIAKTEVGKIERWRMIHAGVRNTISLEFRKEQTNAPSVNGLKAADAEKFIGENCTGDPIPYHVIADDGLTRAAAWKTTLTTLQPGYRSDALVVFPQKGTYCVIDTSATAAGSVSRSAESRQLLGLVDVSGDTEIPDIHQYLKDQLVAAAERTMPDGNPLEKTVRRRVVDDLKNGLKLSLFTPHPTIQDGEVTGKQELAFFINTGTPNAQFEVSNTIGSKFDPKPYDPERIDRTLYLGDIDEWTLQSYFVSHPFHIHVNPFQIVKILDPNGKDVSLPKATDNVGGPDPDPQYPGLKGVWKDTLWIKSLLPQNPNGFYKIVLRTRYQRYIGEFVLHCHILDHEDQGMMQNVSIVLPSQP
ncbi:multicopper oxidase domain-containing protein [Aetokthonos hydrillicola CCALA 1050]|nr:multicopper oxidase domain-containing protein [Aetokthonos hydrillicola CCALA 1050]